MGNNNNNNDNMPYTHGMESQMLILVITGPPQIIEQSSWQMS